MIAVKNILVPLDLSDASAPVLEFARTLADTFGATLHLLHVIGYPLASPQTMSLEQSDACGRLEVLLDAADRSRRHATASCAVGTPAQEIVRYAAGHAVDLIVMGTHRHGPTFRMVTGSIAQSVIGMAPCAVLAVKEAPAGAGNAAFDPLPLATSA